MTRTTATDIPPEMQEEILRLLLHRNRERARLVATLRRVLVARIAAGGRWW